MNKPAMRLTRSATWRWLARSLSALTSVAITAALMAACGGGADSSPDGQQNAGVGSGGTGAFSSGAITDFGSIVVNGIHFDQTTAEVKDADGQVHPYGDLRLGMVVQLDASSVSTSAGKQRAKALFIRYAPDLLGPIDAVGTDTLTVMGQTVRILASTHLDDALAGGLSDLRAGDVVEVYGFHDAGTDTFVATRVARPDPVKPVDHYVVRGVIQDLSGRGCRIGHQNLAYAWPDKPANLRNGQVASAKLYLVPMTVGAGGAGGLLWQAQAMMLSTPLVSDRDDAYVEGLVTELPLGTPGQFSVNGLAVNATSFNCTACASLHLGDHVSVKGRLVQSVITASEVKSLP